MNNEPEKDLNYMISVMVDLQKRIKRLEEAIFGDNK